MERMEKQLTAVQWLVSILNKEGFAQVVTDEEFEQALAMEKEQIILIAEYIRVASQSSPNVTTKDLFNEYQSLQRNL
jgi:hypothetical protein